MRPRPRNCHVRQVTVFGAEKDPLLTRLGPELASFVRNDVLDRLTNKPAASGYQDNRLVQVLNNRHLLHASLGYRPQTHTKPNFNLAFSG